MTILCLARPRDSAPGFFKTWPAARPSLRAVSAVTGSILAVPRTPSVPKIFFCAITLPLDFGLFFILLRRVGAFHRDGARFDVHDGDAFCGIDLHRPRAGWLAQAWGPHEGLQIALLSLIQGHLADAHGDGYGAG